MICASTNGLAVRARPFLSWKLFHDTRQGTMRVARVAAL
jgi:hypothetical protein